LTATISHGSAPVVTATKTFSLAVKSILASDTTAVQDEVAKLPTQIVFTGTDTKDDVTGKFTLPGTGEGGTLIDWVPLSGPICYFPASPPPVYAPVPVDVVRPSADTDVNLNATVSKGGASTTTTVTVKVKRKTTVSDAEAVVEDAKEENILRTTTFSPGDTGGTTGTVTGGFTLPGKGANGTVITWDRPFDETVCKLPPTMPGVGLPVPVDVIPPPTEDKPVVLTGTVSKGGSTQPTTVSVKVKGRGTTGTLAVSVSFANPTAPVFSAAASPALFNKRTTASMTVTATTGFSAYAWWLDGIKQVSSTNVLTLSQSDAALYSGTHRLRLVISQGGRSYSAETSFRVVEE